MKANELFEQIHSGEMKEDTEIDVINELTGQYITTIEFRNGMLNWEPGEFDTSFLCNIDIDFVIEEKKELEEKLDWEEIIDSVGKPVWDNKRKKWRVLDYYSREKNKFKVSFSDISYTENFEEEDLYFKEIKESEEKEE